MLKHKGTVILETERLILRRFKMEDLDQIYHHCWSDPDVWKWSSYEPMDSIDDVFTLNIFTDFWFAKYEKLNYYDWAIQLKSSGEVIGRLRGVKSDDRIGQIELAYELGQNWWYQGLMTEAVNTIIGFFIEEVGFNRIYAAHAHENPASGKVMQKCGMTYEGTARQTCKCNNGVFDMVSYAILANSYLSKNKHDIMKEYEIVEITPDELPQCTSFWDAVNDSRLTWRKTFAYKIGDEYVGGCALFERYEKCGHLSHFVVRSDLRRQGIGSRILEFAIKYLKEMDMEIMRLHVFKDNPSAIRLYERYGFTHAEDITPEKIVMVKTLTE